ncbi:MAG: hypothetical protein AAGJ08_17280 [Cyanobacteria bacterium P01_H01_bin.35]
MSGGTVHNKIVGWVKRQRNPTKTKGLLGFGSSTKPTEKAFCLLLSNSATQQKLLFIYNIVGWVKRQRNRTKTQELLGFVPCFAMLTQTTQPTEKAFCLLL